MLLSPNRDFLVYSLRPLGNALIFNGIALFSLAAISLGVSAVSRSSRNTIVLWIALWIVGGAVAASPDNPAWLRHASFSRNLVEIRKSVFRFDSVLTRAADELPLFNRELTANLHAAADKSTTTNPRGAAVGLGVLVLLSSGIFFRKLRPE